MAESKVKRNNFVTVQGFMLRDLRLKGSELIIYAIIYGFSQSGDGQRYTGSLQYLADWTNSTKRSVINNLNSLIKKGYIVKTEVEKNGSKYCEYSVTFFASDENISLGGEKISLGGGEKISLGGGEKISPNNIDINNIDINNIENMSPSRPASKRKYGEYNNVLLTDKDVEKLQAEYGADMTAKCITFLDEYIEYKGYKAKSHYLAIRKWVVDAVREREKKPAAAAQKPAYNLDHILNAKPQAANSDVKYF